MLNWEVISQALPHLMNGAVLTIELTVSSVFFGVILGLIMALGRLSGKKIIRILSSIYIDFFRGTPLLVQIFLVYFGIPQVFHFQLPDNYQYIAGVLALSLNCGAYTAEIFRSGIQSIDYGQAEAARSLGMSQGQAMRYIILPQAFKVVVPPLGNEFIAMLKDSCLVSIIAIEELMYSGNIIVGRTFQPFPIYITVAFMYLCMTMVLSLLVNYTEKRLAKSDIRN